MLLKEFHYRVVADVLYHLATNGGQRHWTVVCPWLMDAWKILVSAGVTGLAISFRNLVEILSGPVALLGFRPCRTFHTTFFSDSDAWCFYGSVTG